MSLYKEYYCDVKDVRSTLSKYGVAVVKGVLNTEEIKDAEKKMIGMFEFLTKDSKAPFVFNDKKTWRNLYPLYPKHGMLHQHFGVGQSQAVWDVRQNEKVVNVFSTIWDTPSKDLLVSFDGLSFHLPPEVTRRGYFRNNIWLHTDQSYITSEFKCAQGMITLRDCNDGDATLCMREGSHLLHKEFGQKFNITDKNNWYKLKNVEQLDFYKDCPLHCVKAKAGSLILWDSRTIHQGIESKKDRKEQNIREVIYVCYEPRRHATKKDLKKKQKAFNEQRMTTHWAANPKLFPKNPRTYGGPIPTVNKLPRPVLSELGKRLAGF